MSNIVTVDDLVGEVREMTDHVKSDFLDDQEIKRALHRSFGRLWEVIHDDGIPYGETTATVTGTGAETYTLPTDWKSTIAVKYQDGDVWVPLLRIAPSADNEYEPLDGDPLVYRLSGNNLKILPAPGSSITLTHVYITQPTNLTTAPTVDVINAIGHELVLMGAQIYVLKKEESAVSQIAAEYRATQEEFLQRLRQTYWGDAPRMRNVGPLGVEDRLDVRPGDYRD